MHEEGRRAGRGEGGGDLLADVAALADAGDDDAALGGLDQIHGLCEWLAEPVVERGLERAVPSASMSSVRMAEMDAFGVCLPPSIAFKFRMAAPPAVIPRLPDPTAAAATGAKRFTVACVVSSRRGLVSNSGTAVVPRLTLR